MTQEQINQFIRIYNTLCTIETKGENTLIMGDCLRAMQTLAQEIAESAKSLEIKE